MNEKITIQDEVGGWPSIILASSILFGIVSGIFLLFISSFEIGTDFQAFYYAVQAYLSGGDFYDAAPPNHPKHTFLYQPVAILLFLPFGFFTEWTTGYMAQLFQIIVLMLASGYKIIEFIQDRGLNLSYTNKLLIYGYLFLSIFSLPNILHGQINLHISALIGLGLLYYSEGKQRASGLLLSLAATLKIFPAALGLLLLRDRSWPALSTAIGTGLGAIAAGLLIFGFDSYIRFIIILTNRFDNHEFVGGFSPERSIVTLRRPISIIFPEMNPNLMAILAALLLLPCLLYLYLDIDTIMDWLLAAMGTGIVVLLVLPSFFIYFSIVYFPLIPLLFLFPDPGRRLFLAGVFVTNAAFTLRHFRQILDLAPLPEFIRSWAEFIFTPILTFGTPVLYGCVLMLAACVYHKYKLGGDGFQDVFSLVKR